MARQRILLTAVGGMAVLVLASGLHTDTMVVRSHPAPYVLASNHIGIGVSIGGPIMRPECRPPVHEKVIVTGPWRHPHPRRWPHLDVAVVHPPVVGHVVIEHEPQIIVKAPPVVEEGTVTVWITNSNGPATSVTLTRNGPWYVGPRGEWYATMPTNEQLRIVYGF